LKHKKKLRKWVKDANALTNPIPCPRKVIRPPRTHSKHSRRRLERLPPPPAEAATTALGPHALERPPHLVLRGMDLARQIRRIFFFFCWG
jgi:hypothetical protein